MVLHCVTLFLAVYIHTSTWLCVFGERVDVRHAELFSVSYSADETVKIVTYNYSSTQKDVYILYSRGSSLSDLHLPIGTKVKYIEIPIRSAAVMDTTSLAFFEVLGAADKVAAYVPGNANATESSLAAAVLTSPCWQLRNQKGQMDDFDHAQDNPATFDVFFVRLWNSPEEFGNNSVLVGSIAESTPLKRSEWIKFFALFLGKEAEANRLFSEIEERYNCLKRIALKAKSMQPAYQKNIVWFDQFGLDFYPTSSKYLLAFIEDAGGHYQPNCTNSCGRVHSNRLAEMLKYADVVVTTGIESRTVDRFFSSLVKSGISHQLLRNLLAAGSPAMTSQAIYNVDKRLGVGGGIDWMEAAIIEPDVVLLDLIKILYPDFLQYCHHSMSQYQTTFLRNIVRDKTTTFLSEHCNSSNVRPLLGSSLQPCQCSGEQTADLLVILK